MGSLVCNGTKLYQRASSLVRSPVYASVELQPDDSAYYFITNQYTSSSSSTPYWPKGGYYCAGDAVGYSININYDVIDAFLYGDSQYQIWRRRQGSTSNWPRNFFYNGAFSTYHGFGYTEGCECIGAYHFSLPSSYKGKVVEKIQWTVEFSGSIVCYGGPGAKSSNSFFAANASSKGSAWTTAVGKWAYQKWPNNVGFFNQLNNNVCTMFNQCQDAHELEHYRVSGSPNGWELIWTDSGSVYDGAIPLCSTPYYITYELNSDMLSFFNTNGGGWLVSIPQHAHGSTWDTSYPRFRPAYPLYWFCSSFRTYSITIDIKMAD